MSSYSTHVASKGVFTDGAEIASTTKATMTSTTLINDTPLSSTLASPTLSSVPLTVVVAGGTAAAVIVMGCVALVTIFVMVVIVRRTKKPPISANDEELKNMYSYQVTEKHNGECLNLYFYMYSIFVVSRCILSSIYRNWSTYCLCTCRFECSSCRC